MKRPGPATRRWAQTLHGDDKAFQRPSLVLNLSAVPLGTGGIRHNERRDGVWCEAENGPFVRRSGPPLASFNPRWP